MGLGRAPTPTPRPAQAEIYDHISLEVTFHRASVLSTLGRGEQPVHTSFCARENISLR